MRCLQFPFERVQKWTMPHVDVTRQNDLTCGTCWYVSFSVQNTFCGFDVIAPLRLRLSSGIGEPQKSLEECVFCRTENDTYQHVSHVTMTCGIVYILTPNTHLRR